MLIDLSQRMYPPDSLSPVCPATMLQELYQINSITRVEWKVLPVSRGTRESGDVTADSRLYFAFYTLWKLMWYILLKVPVCPEIHSDEHFDGRKYDEEAKEVSRTVKTVDHLKYLGLRNGKLSCCQIATAGIVGRYPAFRYPRNQRECYNIRYGCCIRGYLWQCH